MSLDQTSESEKINQKQKFDEVIQILLSAGYFRARISSLSDFDKVVGGLCWCLTSSGEDIDVDILFQENSTIGQKITLSEAIVKALRKMNCPAQLQPHQIQGGIGGIDFTAIYPVLVWLVKKFFEFREAREKQLRLYSTLQFSKNYNIPGEINLSTLLNVPLKKRVYRRNVSANESEATRVHSCLLEYGELFTKVGDDEGNLDSNKGDGSVKVADNSNISLSALKFSSNTAEMSQFEKQLAKVAKETIKQEELFALHAGKEEAELLKQMAEVQGEVTGISGSQVGSIVSMGSSEIGSAAVAYQTQIDEARKQMEVNMAGGKLGQAAAYKRQKQNLLKQKTEIDEKAIEVNVAISTYAEQLSLTEEERDDALNYNTQLLSEIDKLNLKESSSSSQPELIMLKNLIMLNDSLKAQEAAFKASCKSQMQDYTARIKDIDETLDENTEENRKLHDIEDMYEKVMLKYNRLRQLLAETNIDISNTSRTIDDIPTRTELLQYERRFVELYQQVAWKLDETRKYYALYNTLDTTLNFLQKEVKLLNSVSDNFNEAMRSYESKREYLKQFETIVKGVEDSLVRQESTLVSREKRLDEVKSTYQNLVDEQRRYFKAVKDFQEECNKNEWLTGKFEQLKRDQ